MCYMHVLYIIFMFHGALWTFVLDRQRVQCTERLLEFMLARSQTHTAFSGDFLMQPYALRYCKLVLYLILRAHMMIRMILCPLHCKNECLEARSEREKRIHDIVWSIDEN